VEGDGARGAAGGSVDYIVPSLYTGRSEVGKSETEEMEMNLRFLILFYFPLSPHIAIFRHVRCAFLWTFYAPAMYTRQE
jgi:hypothetical protein